MCLPVGPVGTGATTGLAAGDCPSRLLVMFSSLLTGFLGLPSKHGKQPISLYTSYAYNTTTLDLFVVPLLLPVSTTPSTTTVSECSRGSAHKLLASPIPMHYFAVRHAHTTLRCEHRATKKHPVAAAAWASATLRHSDHCRLHNTPRSSCAPARPESLQLQHITQNGTPALAPTHHTSAALMIRPKQARPSPV